MKASIEKFIEVQKSPRVVQMQGIFDLAPSERSSETWEVEFTLPDEWNVGLIVGPSGSGKTTIANELWGDNMSEEFEWNDDKSVLDDFPKKMSIKEIIALLSSVGFSSPPNWLRPFRVLSTGEQFRVSVARTLAESEDLAVVDEFTSVVDRTVAQIGSAAVAKTIRKRDAKFIAISCHYDIIEWLEPDWVFQPATNEFLTTQDSSGRYKRRRSEITLDVKRVHHSAWKVFGKYHYLDETLNKAAYCFVAYWKERPVAFCAVLSFPHAVSPGWRFHRLVCLPDYQGIGFGVILGDFIGSVFKNTGKPVTRVLAHPAVIHACNKSSVWKMYRAPAMSPNLGKTSKMKSWSVANKRAPAGFKYVGKAADPEFSRILLKGS